MAKYVLIDTETTGLDSVKNQLLEVGLLAVDENLQIEDFANFCVKHKDYNVSAIAMKINGINLAEHEKIAINEEEASVGVLEFLKRNRTTEERLIFMGQNCPFDKDFMAQMFLHTGKIKDYNKEMSHHSLDLMSVAICENIKGNINISKFNLDEISKAYDVTVPDFEIDGINVGRHRALYDCLKELNCFQKILDKKLSTVEDLQALHSGISLSDRMFFDEVKTFDGGYYGAVRYMDYILTANYENKTYEITDINKNILSEGALNERDTLSTLMYNYINEITPKDKSEVIAEEQEKSEPSKDEEKSSVEKSETDDFVKTAYFFKVVPEKERSIKALLTENNVNYLAREVKSANGERSICFAVGYKDKEKVASLRKKNITNTSQPFEPLKK